MKLPYVCLAGWALAYLTNVVVALTPAPQTQATSKATATPTELLNCLNYNIGCAK